MCSIFRSPPGPPNGGTLSATADDTRRAVNGGGEPLEAAQAIASARYTIDEPHWAGAQSFALTATDGSFDETSEEVSAELTSGQLAGATLIFVYAEDVDGNLGPPGAVWIPNPGLDFESGFETP